MQSDPEGLSVHMHFILLRSLFYTLMVAEVCARSVVRAVFFDGQKSFSPSSPFFFLPGEDMQIK
jgi:hypothetical protein